MELEKKGIDYAVNLYLFPTLLNKIYLIIQTTHYCAAGTLVPTLKVKGTLLPAGDTLT